MAVPSNQTLVDEALQTTCYTNGARSSRDVELAGYLASMVVGQPLNPDLTRQQMADEFSKLACLPDQTVQEIIVNQFARLFWGLGPELPNYLWDDVDDLRTVPYDQARVKRQYRTNGLDAPWDGNGGLYAWDPTQTGPGDGQTIIILNDTDGRPGAMRKVA